MALIATLYSLAHLSNAANTYTEATENLQRMRKLAGEIRHLQQLSRTAYVEGEQPKQAIQPWLDCAKSVGIDKQLSDFSGSRLIPISNTDYSQEQVFIRLDRVSCDQVFRFLSNAAQQQKEYVPVSMELQSLPKSSKEAQEIWTANLILTRLVFTAMNRPR